MKATSLTPLEPWIRRKIGGRSGTSEPLRRVDLEAYQLAALRETLAWVRQRNAFYRTHLATAPATIETLEDWNTIPLLTADDLRAEPQRLVCVSQGDIARVVTLDTSGTTGQPKRLYFTAKDQELTVDFFQVGMSTFTVPGDRVVILLPYARPGSVGNLLASALARMGVEGICHGPVSDIAETLALLETTRANGLVGIPAQVLALARALQPKGGFAPRFALLTTDHVPAAIVSAVEGAWGCSVYNHYGMTEMGLGGGVDCAARRGYHLREADLYVEIVDVAGKPLAPGEYGEIVFTTLTRRGMPLLRYRTGDWGRFLQDTCPCGTVLKTLEHVSCRLADRVLVGTEILSLAALSEALFALDGVVDFTATLDRSAGQNALLIRVVAITEIPARAALLAMPVIANAVAIEGLRLEVTMVPVAPEEGYVPMPAKRHFRVVGSG